MDARRRGGERGKKNKDGEQGGRAEDARSSCCYISRGLEVNARFKREHLFISHIRGPALFGMSSRCQRRPSFRSAIEQFNYRHPRINTSQK